MKKIYLLIIPFIWLQSCTFFRTPVKSYSPESVYVKGGIFMYGDVVDSSNTDALPAHEVYVPDFLLGKHEVTFEQFDAYAAEQGLELPDDQNYGRGKRAVTNITWDEALAFCESLGMRLPTEWEWEYAAREGGKNIRFSGTNEADSLSQYAVLRSSGINFAYFVASRKSNALGLYDMSGNVFEWIGEFYQFYSQPEMRHNMEADGIRIIRGGSFAEETAATRTYWRVGTLHDVRATDIGFRCAQSIK